MKHITLLLLFLATTATAQFLEDKVGKQTFKGYFDFHYIEDEGKIYLEVDKLNEEFLYVQSLSTGIGSNDIGLDRGQLGNEVVVEFVRSGEKLLLVQKNLKFRANSDNMPERRSIEQAFARSVLFGFPIKEQKNGAFLIDLTPFLYLDAHGVTQRLKQQKEGTYKLDPKRSALWMERTKAFEKNVEFEAMLTFVGQPTGRNLRTVAPDARSVSVVQHHSFIELPDSNYSPRAFDPRSGSFSISYMDYATPVWEPITKRFITRHRLEKKDPNAAVSDPVDPIIYYLDPGTPEPVRSALLEGARWWNQAFEAAGFRNAFQVKMLPADADPLDVRYNVIQWVHRSTRGWSYGASVIDPRTGEIIKGHVSLGSLRIRQDYMIAQALMNKPFAQRDDNYQPMLEMALARIRQLSAHEVGHTLGFAHNFAASTNGRASVMDYPHPTLSVRNGEVDFSNAYDTGIGEWDKVTVAYSYGQPSAGNSEQAYLDGVLASAAQQGLRYISDPDARPQSGAHALAHLWDNGVDPSTELNNVLEVRKTAMQHFGPDNIRSGEPFSSLEDVFVPLYFYHRYQTEAVVKLVGGMEYDYSVKKGNERLPVYLDRNTQRKALDAILSTLDPQTLMIPREKLDLFPPRAYGFNRSRESFKSSMGVAFDALGAAATASDMTLGLLFNPQRANRLVQQKALDSDQLGLDDVIDAVLDRAMQNPRDSYECELAQTVQYRAVQHMMNLSRHSSTLPQVKGMAQDGLDQVRAAMNSASSAFGREMVRQIDAFRKSPEKFEVFAVPNIPDGSPIGSEACTFNPDRL